MSSLTPSQAIIVALQHHRAGQLQQAEAIYRQVLTADRRNADALNLLGVIAHQTGHDPDAQQLIAHAIEINPRVADYHSNLGEVLAALGDRARAAACYRQAIAINPAFVPAYNNLGMLLQSQNRTADAVATFRAATTVGPEYSGTWSNLGISLTLQGDLDAAVDAFLEALRLDPNHADARGNLGLLRYSQNRMEDAVAELRRAIELRPNHADAHLNLGNALQAQGRVEEAIAAYETALSIRPHDFRAHSNLLLARHYLPQDRASLFRAHLDWAERHIPAPVPDAPPPPAELQNPRDPDRRLRIGYSSSDFKLHSVAFFIEPILAAHDRAAVEVFCYSDVAAPDDTTRRLQRRADVWRDVVGLSDAEFIQQVRADRIDILIDLSGHTGVHRLRAFAGRAAPVQATYLGYPDTTGLPAIDYRITDGLADPPGAEAFHTERLVRLRRCAWCYGPPDVSPHPGNLPAKEAGHITFGSFNVITKLSPATMDVWAQVLSAVPSSRLMLKSTAFGEEPSRARVAAAFVDRGVAPDRLTLRGRDPVLKHHLRAYQEIDIALDTWPYNGTTTTCDALWMGVPVITLAGDAHVSRVGVSLLNAVGLAHLVATSPEQYVEIAKEMAADVPKLSKLRGTLRQTMQKSPLTDGPSLSRALEAAYREMWQAYLATAGRSAP